MSNEQEIMDEFWKVEKRRSELYSFCCEFVEVLEWLERKGNINNPLDKETIHELVKRFKESKGE